MNSTDNMKGAARECTEEMQAPEKMEDLSMEQMVEEAKSFGAVGDEEAKGYFVDEVLKTLGQRSKQLYNKTQEANRMGASSSTIDALLTRRDEVGRLLNFIRNLE